MRVTNIILVLTVGDDRGKPVSGPVAMNNEQTHETEVAKPGSRTGFETDIS